MNVAYIELVGICDTGFVFKLQMRSSSDTALRGDVF